MDLMQMIAAGKSMFGGGSVAPGTVPATAALPQAQPSLGPVPQVQGSSQFAAPVAVPTAQGTISPVQFGANVNNPPVMNPTLGAPQLSAANPEGIQPQQKILGMNPQAFASLTGMLAGAFTPKDSWQSRVGAAGAQMAQTNTLAQAQLKRDQDHQKFLSEALKYYPSHIVQGLASHSVVNTGVFSPEGGYGNPYAVPAPILGGGNE